MQIFSQTTNAALVLTTHRISIIVIFIIIFICLVILVTLIS